MTYFMPHNEIQALAEAFQSMLVEEENCGWFDGGCYTFAVVLHFIMGDSVEIMHVSRSEHDRDHAVVYHKATNTYLDADGIQSEEELMSKMLNQELTEVTGIWPFENILDFPVFHSIVVKMTHHYLQKEAIK